MKQLEIKKIPLLVIVHVKKFIHIDNLKDKIMIQKNVRLWDSQIRVCMRIVQRWKIKILNGKLNF